MASIGEHCAIDTLTRPPAAAGADDTFGHPRGLTYLAIAEGWAAFGIYGIQALLVLYMAGWLFTPGHFGNVTGFAAWRSGVEAVFGPMPLQALATQTMGLYLGLQFLVPIAGGWLGDRWLGSRRAMLLGLALSAGGAGLLVFEASFLPGLLLLTLGAGTFRCNLHAQTGHLYARDDVRSTAAFAIIATALNIGAFVTPLVVGSLGERVGWHWGFLAAFGGLALGLVAALAGNRAMPPDRDAETRASARLEPGDGRSIITLIAVLLIVATFWLAQAQVWNVYVLWGRDHLDRHMFGQEMPVTWLQSIDSLAPILALPLVLGLWRWQARSGREPGELGKIGIGCALIAVSFAWLAAGATDATPFAWVIVFHIVLNTGWLYVVPTTNALVARTAPVAVTGVMLGMVQGAIFVGSTAAGWLGRFYLTMPAPQFWLLHAAVPAAGAVAMLVFRKPLGRVLKL